MRRMLCLDQLAIRGIRYRSARRHFLGLGMDQIYPIVFRKRFPLSASDCNAHPLTLHYNRKTADYAVRYYFFEVRNQKNTLCLSCERNKKIKRLFR